MPKLESFLFNPGAVHGNVDLRTKFYRPAIEFGLYADSFCKAAYCLVLDLEESSGYSDLDACPIAFLYRHALGLYFKSIIMIGIDILKLEGKNLTELYMLVDSGNIFAVHELGKLFLHVKTVFIEIWGPWPVGEGDIPSFEEANKIIEDLDNVDKKSFAFRYPTNKGGSPCEPRELIFNIIDFSHSLQRFGEFLESAYFGLLAVFDSCCECLYDQ